MNEDNWLEAAYEDRNGGDFNTAREWDEFEYDCPLCGEDCEQRPVDCCDCLLWDCEVAQDDEVRVCAPLSGGYSPCEHHDKYEEK